MQELKLIGKECPIARGGCNFLQYDKGKYLVIGGVNRSENGLQEFNDFWTLHLPLKDGNLAGIWKELTLENQQLYTSRSSQAACISDDKMIYIFGGQKFLESQSTDEFYRIDTAQKVLTIVKSKNKPKARNSHTLTYFNERLFLFGGANENGPLNDLHIYDIKSEVWQQIKDVSELIMAREMHTAHILQMNLKPLKKSEDNKAQKLIGIFNELQGEQKEQIQQIAVKEQIIEQANNEIQQQQQKEQEQQQQQDQQQQQQQQQIKDNQQDYLIILGGRNKNDLLQDIQVINLSTFEVDQIENLPTPLCAHTSVKVKQDIWIFGGCDGASLNSNIYQLQDQTIKKVGTIQTAIMASSALYSEELNKIIIFGGCTLDRDLNQTFVVQI
ncbi:unnamed protein product (macronuclear) [Paramecium tetraurelia]|uniref:Kelch motif family protein n=1 Tax=Paramecium tetraurelia TaxID=5888 RepID=A0DNY3_PARTE|nr:uncharacterized protein GSPATT00018946001 [Paramecium tetraurelia]CAK84750.1 unnamed protein product [Paramecium tetraurelia]|eukprot:XP_001452147.1 hypothetical protein (macronuclear) [Paramecium tetraurelia strain d4-2]